ncbi:MAG: hypothetical protein KDC92_09620 [Bacteroidetes bacterium]|nr:hypothetical protein [Bacteroidota bacterium]
MNKSAALIARYLTEILTKTYDEDSIRNLLIAFRDKLKGNSFLKEVAHFIAHPEREQGICHSQIDTLYIKNKLLGDQVQKMIDNEIIEKNKDNNKFLEREMLNYIDYRKINKTVFDLVFIKGADLFDPQLFKKHYGKSKEQILQFIKRCYNLSEGFYELRYIPASDLIYLDEYTRFIRGTFQLKSVFDIEVLKSEFKHSFESEVQRLNIKGDSSILAKELDNIVICFLSIMNDAKFKLFDGTVAPGYLGVYQDDQSDNYEIVYIVEGWFKYPLISTGIDFHSLTDTDIKLESFERIPFNFLSRSGENLKFSNI